MIRRSCAILAACLLIVPAQATPITDFTALEAEDRARVNAVEQAFFDQISEGGIEHAWTRTFTALRSTDALTPENLSVIREVDRTCSPLLSVERIASRSFGSRVVHQTLVSLHGTCLIKWEITIAKPSIAWQIDKLTFNTLTGNNWNQ